MPTEELARRQSVRQDRTPAILQAHRKLAWTTPGNLPNSQTVVSLIANTTTVTGLTVRADLDLDLNLYPN